MLRGAQKLANRVASGVMVAAFVVTAALFSSGRTSVTVGGYPLLTIVFLCLAALMAVWVGVGILRSDLPQRRTRRR